MTKVLSSNPRVLLTTCFRRFPSDYWDIVGETTYDLPRVTVPRRMGFGLHFIKQNVPEVEILDYPMWHDYVKKLKEGWDVVGFSFHQNEIAEIELMADEARRHGVKEIWAGNYGALDYKIPKIADRIFTGPGEDHVAQAFGYRVPEGSVKHPPLFMPLSFLPGNIRHLTLGVLFTERGCPYKCTFCQTPSFNTRMSTIDFESVERVLRYYKKLGITDVFPQDELFGVFADYTDKLTRLFAKYKFRWWAQSRATMFTRHLDKWYERGLRFPLIGLESMNQKSLDDLDKKQSVEEILEYARRTREKKDMYRMVYTMIGYPHMTVEDTIESAVFLKRAGFDAHTISVLTPFPKTPLWDEYDAKYGIFERKYRNFDLKHLVWNHPLMSPVQMHYLRATVIHYLNRSTDIYLKNFLRLATVRLERQGLGFVWRDLIKGPISSLLINDRKQVFLPKN